MSANFNYWSSMPSYSGYTDYPSADSGYGWSSFNWGNLFPNCDLNSSNGSTAQQNSAYYGWENFWGWQNTPFQNLPNNIPPGNPGQSPPGGSNQRPINTTIIEVGYYNNGEMDEHAQAVKEVYARSNPQGNNTVRMEGIGYDAPSNNGTSSQGSSRLTSKADLDKLIDSESSDAFNIMTDEISALVEKGDTDVVNGSLGYSRNTIYENTLLALRENPNLASAFGLRKSDITSLETQDGQLLVTDKVADAVVRYVDGRMDRESSAYNQSKAKYQQVTKQAADKGMVIVIAAGNEHELNSVFDARRQGGDTNFLAQSDHVISVAATDDKGTVSTHDDTMSTFSSWGDGRFNPTIAADGVDVQTRQGTMDGTSFAAPQVAALVARIKQANPDLTFEQIKNILQQSATDIIPNSTIADGAGIVNPELAVQWARQPLALSA